jgi:hypothetical protein
VTLRGISALIQCLTGEVANNKAEFYTSVAEILCAMSRSIAIIFINFESSPSPPKLENLQSSTDQIRG